MKTFEITRDELVAIRDAATACSDSSADPELRQRLDGLRGKYPELAGLPVDDIARMPSGYEDEEVPGWKCESGSESTFTDEQMSALMRGELRFSQIADDMTDDGSWKECWTNKGLDLRMNLIWFDDSHDSSLFREIADYAKDNTDSLPYLSLIPRSHRGHRRLTLAPTTESPIPIETQSKLIGRIPFLYGKRGWLIVGPAGSSKTTYVSVSMLDLLACRGFDYPYANWINPKDLREAYFDNSTQPIFRVNVPDWLAAMQEYETRDFGVEHYLQPKPPLPNPKDLTDRDRPVVWLEEIDKFRATEARLGYLFRLVNAVYEAGGLIVASANMTIVRLKEHLGAPIYRRIAGEFEPDSEAEKFQVWDLHRAAK